MSTATAGRVPRFADPADAARARGRLADAGFTGRGITERLKVATVPTAGVLNHPLYLWRTRGGDALDTFIRLFLLYGNVPADAVREALRPMTLETWVEAGLLRPVDGSGDVAGTVRMLPYGDLLVVTDRPPRTEAEIPADFVMSVGAATITLANATVRRRSRRTLDLGCGCGTLGLLAARHSDEVYALDMNGRAVEYAAFNAACNSLANVRPLQGNLFEPVSELRNSFDLIVCNPPFVISPESRYLYRDSGRRGDEICRDIVAISPQYLAEGGYCQMLCNWAHVRGEDWKRHLASWFEGSGCDAWVIRYETRDAARYADTWVRQSEADLFDQWMRYYDREGIEAVSLGLVNLRRRASGRPNWVRFDHAPKPDRPVGDDILRGFGLRQYLEETDDAALLAAHLRVNSDVRLDQESEPRDGAWRARESTLSRDAATAPRGNADPHVLRLMAGCNGRRPLGEIVGTIAASLGRSPADVTPAMLPIVRQLVLEAFLVPAAEITSP
jgi:SAM-dependent methyltransferase